MNMHFRRQPLHGGLAAEVSARAGFGYDGSRLTMLEVGVRVASKEGKV